MLVVHAQRGVSALSRRGVGASADRPDPVQAFLRLMLEHQPGPLVLLPPGTVPEGQ